VTGVSVLCVWLLCWKFAKSAELKCWCLGWPIFDEAKAASIRACSPASNSADHPGDGVRCVGVWYAGRSRLICSMANAGGIWPGC
jgi:hypothetical protein